MSKTIKAVETFKEIAKGEGPYDQDKLKHASNCIDSMKALAEEGITNLKTDGNYDKAVLDSFQNMCEESLDPEQFEAFEATKAALIKARKGL